MIEGRQRFCKKDTPDLLPKGYFQPLLTTLLFHVQQLLGGGIERVLISLLRSLPADRYRVRLLITYDFGKAEFWREDIPSHVSVSYLLPPSILTRTHIAKKTAKVSPIQKGLNEVLLTPLRNALIKRRLPEALAGADLLIDFDMTLAPWHRSLTGIKKVAYCHFSLPHYHDGNPRRLARLAARLAHYDKVVMLCDEMKESAAAMFTALAPRLVRIYNSVDIEGIQRAALEPLPAEAEPWLRVGYLVSVGRLHEAQKDFTTLIRAFAQCVETHGIPQHLVIVGYGGALESLKALAAQLGIGDRVHFIGFDANPHRWVVRSDLFVFSSKYEGLPTVLIEALALGRNIVATECPTGVRELLMDGQAGTLVPVGNTAIMSDAIAELLSNPLLAAEQRVAATSFLQTFSLSQNLEEIDRLLIEPLLNGPDIR